MASPGVRDNEPEARRPLSLFHGPTDQPLWKDSLAGFLDRQCQRHGSRECIVTPWTGDRWTYNRLRDESSFLARYLHSRGIRPGDRIGILAGNRVEYASVFFACMRLGVILVILNNTYTATEAEYGLNYTECKMLFTTPHIGRTDNSALVSSLRTRRDRVPHLREIILLAESLDGIAEYRSVVNIGRQMDGQPVRSIQSRLDPYETCNLQFTSGSTGHPKAAMLTHHGLLNNSRFIGDRMALTPTDILCCPPPLFHCFGLVLGLLAVITHGAKIVYPSEVFDGAAVLAAVSDEKCTALHGVPAMFETLFSLDRPANFDVSNLRTGIIAGAPVPRHLMESLVNEFGMTEFTSSYGLTEASPTCFNAFIDDSIDTRLATVGSLMPHAHAKIVDRDGNILPVYSRGELCIAGYQIQRGYWRNEAQTAAAMVADRDGTVWLHTGDEAVMDPHGYCSITGRFKDIIIRGGENIYPLEIEERLVAHPAVDRAVVVGLPHPRYQEVPAAFLLRAPGVADRPSDDDLRRWTRESLGRHKAPVHVFWLGEGGVPDALPLTGSGKIKKFEMRKLGEELLAASVKAKL